MGSAQHVKVRLAYPDSQPAGKYVFIANENNTIFRSATSGAVRPVGGSNPPGVQVSPYDKWPSDADLKAFWGKLD
jgi:hypothetical protein